MELQKQLRLFPRPGIQLLQLCFVIEIIRVIKILGLFGTEADAAVALHALAGHQVGVLRVNGPQRTFPGAQAALHALVRVDFIFAAHIINGLHGTFCGAVVAADTVFCDLIHPVPFLPLNDFEPLEPNLKRKLLKINIIITETLPD